MPLHNPLILAKEVASLDQFKRRTFHARWESERRSRNLMLCASRGKGGRGGLTNISKRCRQAGEDFQAFFPSVISAEGEE